MNVSERYWLDRATEKIRFAPDRRAVRAELEGHLLEREERYLSRGMTAAQAAKAAVADMGDAEEVAVALGRIHAPWWGYLWRASRWALVIAAVMLCFQLYEELQPWGRLEVTFPAYEPQVGDVSTTAAGREYETLAVWEPEGSVHLSHYRVTAPTVYLEYSDAFTYEYGDVSPAYHTLHIWIKATTWRFWEPMAGSQFMILNRRAADSLGRVYAWDPQRDPEEIYSLFCNSYANPLSVWWAVELELPGGEVPDWVEIPIGPGDDMIRVDLKEGGIS